VSAFPDIDLSLLPVPEIFAPIDAKSLEQDLADTFAALHPPSAETIMLNSDPMRKVLQLVAYRAALQRDDFRKDAAIGLVATASGNGLDQRAAQIPLTRLSGESDDEFRKRIRFAFDGFSSAGPRGAYRFHAENAHVDVRSVVVRSPRVSDTGSDAPEAGQVFVYVIGAADGTLPITVRDAVEVALNDEFVIPTSADVQVKDPEIVAFDVTATLTIDVDLSPQLITAAAQAALESYLSGSLDFGGRITRTDIITALNVEGVVEVELQAPAQSPTSNPYAVPVAGVVSLLAAET